MTMNEHCERPIDELVAYTDGELQAPAHGALEAHLDVCARCAREVDLLRRSGALVAELPGLTPSAGFVDRVVAATADVRRPRGRLLRLLPAAAAAVLIVGLVLARAMRDDRPSDEVALSRAEEREIAQDLFLLENLDALADEDPEALIAIIEDLDLIESVEPEAFGIFDGEEGG